MAANESFPLSLSILMAPDRLHEFSFAWGVFIQFIKGYRALHLWVLYRNIQVVEVY